MSGERQDSNIGSSLPTARAVFVLAGRLFGQNLVSLLLLAFAPLAISYILIELISPGEGVRGLYQFSEDNQFQLNVSWSVFGFLGLANLATSLFVQAITVRAGLVIVSQKRVVEPSELWQITKPFFGRLILTGIVLFLLVGFGLLLLIIPGLYFLLVYGLSVNAAADDRVVGGVDVCMKMAKKLIFSNLGFVLAVSVLALGLIILIGTLSPALGRLTDLINAVLSIYLILVYGQVYHLLKGRLKLKSK